MHIYIHQQIANEDEHDKSLSVIVGEDADVYGSETSDSEDGSEKVQENNPETGESLEESEEDESDDESEEDSDEQIKKTKKTGVRAPPGWDMYIFFKGISWSSFCDLCT